VGITSFDQQGISLSQNIPNPATDNTVIRYSVPSDGSVTFNVYSISGQVLYSQTAETSFGAHSIELNTSDLSAGIYFYSMEFKGQRLIKRMVIER
ncbi:MAG: T9SS type A sorting domain-containing protein, partial [Bacteroidales bacterium]|nr:T9SS type A sorting domain-containing protein [Bacteroidales bacterium]